MNILDSRFRYTPAIHTNLRETFARVNEPEQREPDLEGALQVMRTLKQQVDDLACGTE